MEFKLNEYHKDISDEELINDLLNVSKKLNKTYISHKDYIENGKYSLTPYRNRFHNWESALKAANLDSKPRKNSYRVSETELIDDIKNVSRIINRSSVSVQDYRQYGCFSINTIYGRFGDWKSALMKAGLKTKDNIDNRHIENIQLISEIERLWVELGRQPTTTDIRNGLSKYSLNTYARHFGSWRNALIAFIEYINESDCCCEYENEEKNNNDSTISDRINQKESNKPVHKTKRDINLRLRFKVMQRDNFKCCMCGASPAKDPSVELHIDHIIPWSKGGETTIDNLQTLCSKCNLGKSDLF